MLLVGWWGYHSVKYSFCLPVATTVVKVGYWHTFVWCLAKKLIKSYKFDKEGRRKRKRTLPGVIKLQNQAKLFGQTINIL